MKKNMWLVSILAILIFSGCSDASRESQNQSIKISGQESIDTIQLNTTRVNPKDYGADKLSSLIDNLESVAPLSADESAALYYKDEYNPTITFIYKDGTKDIFYFFENHGTWYLKTDEKHYYKDADFIDDYIHGEKVDAQFIPIMSSEYFKLSLKLAQEQETPDIPFAFIYLVQGNIEYNEYTEKDAIIHVRESMIHNMKVYQYALQSNYDISAAELSSVINKYVSDTLNSEEYIEYEKYLEDAGITLQQLAEKYKESIRYITITNKLYLDKQIEFKNGKDKVGDKVCKSVDEYYKTFIEDVVYTKMKDYNLNDFSSELDEAEKIYAVCREFAS